MDGRSTARGEESCGSSAAADSHDVCAGAAIRIGDELPLSMEVADRAVVDRGILAIALPGAAPCSEVSAADP